MKLFGQVIFFILTLFISVSLAYGKTLNVVTSFSILADIAKNVGQHHVSVKSLVGNGGDIHVYEPRPSDIKALKYADIFIINGLGLEGWMNRLIESSDYDGPIIVSTEGIATITHRHNHNGLIKDQHEHEASNIIPDPHVWHDLKNGLIYTENIATAFKRADPKNVEDYDKFKQAYQQKIRMLHAWVKQTLESIPQESRKAVTTHDSFNYFEHAYGITFYSPLGWNTESVPSAGDVARLIRQMRQSKIKVVFSENIVDSRLIELISRDAHGQVGGKLFSDALSKEGGQANTYLKMIRHNTKVIATALSPTK